MLTIKQNLLETINGGNPDRLVNQYEFLATVSNPVGAASRCPRGKTIVTSWGYTLRFDEDSPGAFPVHTPEAIVVKDLARWKDVVNPPDPWAFTNEQWEPFEKQAESIDCSEKFLTTSKATGLFERLHYLMGIENALIALYEEPEYSLELIEFITDWEIELAKVIIQRLKPEALFQHDDWGTQINSFFSPATFEKFFVPSYKKLYGFYKDNGVELIVHHSDSYAANLVPSMIEIGIDIWQGAVQENNLPELIGKYGEQISIMSGLDSGKYDTVDWSREKIRKGLEEVVESCGSHFFIPCASQGAAMSTFSGVYDTISEEIDVLSQRIFS